MSTATVVSSNDVTKNNHVATTNSIHHRPATRPSSATTATTASTTTTSSNNSRTATRKVFAFGNFRFQLSNHYTRYMDLVFDGISYALEGIVYMIGPLLILLALAIISLMVYTFITIILPMMQLKHQQSTFRFILSMTIHCSIVLFLLVNVLFNYYHCVMTPHKGKLYNTIVRELALATNFIYPETPMELLQYRQDYEDLMVIRLRRRNARNNHPNQSSSSSPPGLVVPTTTSSNSTNTTNHATTTTTTTIPDSIATVNGTTTTAAAASSTSSTSATNAITSSSSITSQMTHRKGPLMAPLLLNTSTTMNMNGSASSAAAAAASGGGNNNNIPRAWTLMGPLEWGYCSRTKQPKPPRSHYDHVSKQLVLNLDHYCPWMFNAVGYFNYRYFVNFLLYIFIGMVYGTIVAWEPFMLLDTDEYYKQVQMENRNGLPKGYRIQPMLPYRDEKMLISLCFMLSVAVGLAVATLLGFHIYLTLTAQTTIEFHGNWSNRKRARQYGQKWRNPYSQGVLANWQQLYGKRHWLIALLPSKREPEFLPVPIPGHPGRISRHSEQQQKQQQYDEEEEDQSSIHDSSTSTVITTNHATDRRINSLPV